MFRAGQYVGIYRTSAISLKYWDAISKKYYKTDYRDIGISQKNRLYCNIFGVEHLKYMEYHKKISIYWPNPSQKSLKLVELCNIYGPNRGQISQNRPALSVIHSCNLDAHMRYNKFFFSHRIEEVFGIDRGHYRRRYQPNGYMFSYEKGWILLKLTSVQKVNNHYSGIQCNHRHCYFKIITLNEPNPLAYHDLWPLEV